MLRAAQPVRPTDQYPLRHPSIRVPWNDTGWDGRVCENPSANTSCLILKNIGMTRDDAAETAVRGKSLDVLAEDRRPCCVGERGFVRAPFEFTLSKSHRYSENSADTHGHIRPTTLRNPPYSADAVPFRWMRTEQSDYLRDTYRLDLDPEREPKLSFESGEQWLQQRDNQAAVLDWYFGHVHPDESLCFFHAKRTPLAEDPWRAIVGVGLVRHVSANKEYEYAAPPTAGQLRPQLCVVTQMAPTIARLIGTPQPTGQSPRY